MFGIMQSSSYATLRETRQIYRERKQDGGMKGRGMKGGGGALVFHVWINPNPTQLYTQLLLTL